MDTKLLTQLWSDLWDKGLWAAPWQKAIGDLTPQQAVWKPDPARKSIWQFVSHVSFWRNFMLDREAGNPRPSDEEIAQKQYAEPVNPTETDWNDARAAFQASHQRMVAAAAERKIPAEKLAPPLAHDAYHLGQVMYLRALQGLPPIE